METRSEVTVEITLAPGDFYHPLDWSWGNLIRYVLAVVSILLVFDAWRNWSSPASEIKIGLMVFLALAFLFPWIRMRYLFRRYPAFRKPRSFTFDAVGMHFQSEDASGDYKWPTFSKVVETPRAFIFMQTSRGGTTIPKRFFTQRDEISLLRKLLRESFKGTLKLRAD